MKLVLEVDDERIGTAGAGQPAGPAGDRPAAREPEVETLDPSDYAEEDPNAASDQASEADARLLEAFPGASEVLG